MSPADRSLARSALAGCVVFILYMTLQPFRFDQSPRFAKLGLFHSVPDLAMNFAMFIPIGILAAVCARPAAREASALRSILFASGFGSSLSLVIEALQTMNRDRSASLGDLITNTLGATAGGSIAVMVVAFLGTQRGIEIVDRVVRNPWTTGLVGLLVAYVLLPFADAKRVEDGLYLLRHHLPSKLERRIDLAELLLFLAIGRAFATDGSVGRAIGLIVALVIGLEVFRLPVLLGRPVLLPPLSSGLAGMLGCVSARFAPLAGRSDSLAMAFSILLPLAGFIGDGFVGRGHHELFPRLGPREIVRVAKLMILFAPLGVVFVSSLRARVGCVISLYACSWVLPQASSAPVVALAPFLFAASLGAAVARRVEGPSR
ncbi:MAG: VanZ family protein [Deltaproteobacteria bacterium]|nr:VanZ family protein [Deltaproteobacteria bacterium]